MNIAARIVEALQPQHGKVYIDMTFGAGKLSRQLLDTNKSIKIIAVDRDPAAYRLANQLAKELQVKSAKLGIRQSIVPIHACFKQAKRSIHLAGVPFSTVHGLIFDLGPSTLQYADPQRGFSTESDGPLDMRMDTSNISDITAEDVVNNLSQENLAIVLKLYGPERKARKIANAIVDARTLLGRIRTTKELAKIVASCSSSANIDTFASTSHPATNTFRALRIFVNNELNELNYALDDIREFLIPAKSTDDALQGRCGLAAVLSRDSNEDRIVKRHFSGIDVHEPAVKYLSQHDRIRTNESPDQQRVKGGPKKWLQLLKYVPEPGDEELVRDPHSYNARLRIAARLL